MGEGRGTIAREKEPVCADHRCVEFLPLLSCEVKLDRVTEIVLPACEEKVERHDHDIDAQHTHQCERQPDKGKGCGGIVRDACSRPLPRVEAYQLQKRQEQEESDALRNGEARAECCG